jgi:endonuclease/exonuclease/phosphatase family metal-dependent hydrolase
VVPLDTSGQCLPESGRAEVWSSDVGPGSPGQHSEAKLARRLSLLGKVLLVALAAWGVAEARTRARPKPPATGGAPASTAPAQVPASTSVSAPGAFGSAEGCAVELAAGRRLWRPTGTARFASWNLLWFPDGKPGRSGGGADLAWLSCALWWLDADVIAVQEVKQTPHAELALQQLLSELNRISGGRYRAALDDCGSRVPQHVGLLWNEARVQASAGSTVAALNPSGEPCTNQWRPGYAARLRFPGGLDLVAVSGHFKSMSDSRSLELRRVSFGALADVLRENEARYNDADLLLLGDLNTMGCETCTPPITAAQELASAAQVLANGDLRLVAADAAGSHFYEGRASLLDHAVASRRMQELAATTRSHIAGACAAGAQVTVKKRAKKLLSDHCPLVLDLSDRDLD